MRLRLIPPCSLARVTACIQMASSGKIGRLSRLLEDRKIAITLTPAAREWLADKGWDPAYGARPLKRVIQKAIQDPLAELVLAGTVKDGDRVEISASKQGLTFNGKLAAAA